MISKVVRNNLILDVVDRSASDLVLAYPEEFTSSSDVPEFLYKSLNTLWTGAASSELAKCVVDDPGVGKESSASIDIVTDKMIPSSLFPRGAQSDDPGAFTTFCRIILYKPRTRAASSDAINQAALRIAYVLDHPTRNQRQLGQLSVSGSPMVSSDYLRMYLEEISGPGGSKIMSSSALELVFRCEYRLQFLK